MTNLKLDYLAIQEPPTTPLTPERNNQHDKPFQPNFKIISTPHNKIIIGPNLSHTIIDYHTFAQGRGQYVTLKTQNKTLTIYSIYDYQHQHKESLINIYKRTTTVVKQKHPDTHIILLDDFQTHSPSTTTQTINTTRKPTPKHLLSTYINTPPRTHESIVPYLHPNTPYITRWSHNSGRALDHIYIPNSLLDNITHANIDYTISQHHTNSDHELIYADINTNIDTRNPSTTNQTNKIPYHILNKIPLIMSTYDENTNPDPWFIYDHNSPQPPIKPSPTHETLLQDAHKIAQTNKKATNHLNLAKTSINSCHQHITQHYHGPTIPPNYIPPRSKTLRHHLSNAYDHLIQGIDTIIKTLHETHHPKQKNTKDKVNKPPPTHTPRTNLQKTNPFSKAISTTQKCLGLNRKLQKILIAKHSNLTKITSLLTKTNNDLKKTIKLLPNHIKNFETHIYNTRINMHAQTTHKPQQKSHKHTPPSYMTPHIQQNCKHAQELYATKLTHWDDPSFSTQRKTNLTKIVTHIINDTPPNDNTPTNNIIKKQYKYLQRLKTKITLSQYQLTISIQQYLHNTNQMGSLCHITNPPQRDPPQTEAYTLTPNTTYGQPPQRSPAVTIYDQIQATYDVHNKQMSPPPRHTTLLCITQIRRRWMLRY